MGFSGLARVNGSLVLRLHFLILSHRIQKNGAP